VPDSASRSLAGELVCFKQTDDRIVHIVFAVVGLYRHDSGVSEGSLGKCVSEYDHRRFGIRHWSLQIPLIARFLVAEHESFRKSPQDLSLAAGPKPRLRLVKGLACLQIQDSGRMVSASPGSLYLQQ